MLQGVTSFHELATPIIGRLRSSSFNPIARNIERCGARSGPSVTAQLRCLSLRSAINVESPSVKTQKDITASEGWMSRQLGGGGVHAGRVPAFFSQSLQISLRNFLNQA